MNGWVKNNERKCVFELQFHAKKDHFDSNQKDVFLRFSRAHKEMFYMIT